MNYTETVEWMFNRLPLFQQVGASAYKKDLTNTLALANHLGNPEKQLRCIHVAGTNGKGSTSHLLASVLQEAGYKVGLYTSPHLKDYRERIKINGAMIPESFVVDFVAQHKNFLEAQELSFFEMTVGLAFDYFAKEQTDINIIEVGMGGRLDSTNIITPLLSVVTNIGLDHTQFLGDTLEAIAGEKAGIVKASIPVVIGEYTLETRAVFETKAAQTQSAIYFASDIQTQTYPSALKGAYQEANKKTVQQALTVLNLVSNFDITESQIQAGFENVVANTGLLGRWQVLGEQPKIIADTAHNEHGLRIVLQQLREEPKQRLHIVLGVVNDKDLTKILPLFPKEALYYFCKPNIPRGLKASVLGQLASDFGLTGKVYDSVSNAYQKAREQARPDDVIYVGGSTFVVAELF